MKRSDIKNPLKSNTGLQLVKFRRLLNRPTEQREFYDAVVNIPFIDKRYSTSLGLGFLSLALVNEKRKTIDRIAISATEPAQGAINVTVKAFKDLIIPIDAPDNAVAKAIKTANVVQTNDWYYLLTPVLDESEARINQAGAGIAYSCIYPVVVNKNAIGAIIYQYYITPDRISKKHRHFMKSYTTMVTSRLIKL